MRYRIEELESPAVDLLSQPSASFPSAPSDDGVQSLCLNLHGLSVELRVSSASLLTYCQSLFRHYLSTGQRAEISVQLALVDSPPTRPALSASTPIVRQPPRIIGIASQQCLYLETPGKGAFVIDRSKPTITGHFTAELLEDQNLFDRLLVGSLTLLLRQWGFFAVHGFCAAHGGHAALLVGGSGSGKTTAGLALVRAGWGFLANDLPLLREKVRGLYVFSCPERVRVTTETISLLPELQSLATAGAGKLDFYIEDLYPGAMVARAALKWLLFPRVRKDQPTRLNRVSASDTLIALLPHSMATWDKTMASTQFSLLERLARTIPAYQIDLGTDFEGWGSLLTDLPNTPR